MGSCKLIQKVLFENQPKILTQYVAFSLQCTELVRYIRKPFIIHKPNSSELAQSALYRAIYIYNKLGYEIKTLNPKMFSKKIYTEIKHIFAPFDIPKNDYG